MKGLGIKLLTAGLVLGSVALLADALTPDPLSVDTELVARGNLTVALKDEGVVRIRDKYVVSAPISGIVLRLGLRPGDRVEEGGTLARLMPMPSPLLDAQARSISLGRLRAAEDGKAQSEVSLERAREALRMAQNDLARTQSLAQQQALPAQALEHAEFEANVRATELRALEFSSRVAAHEVDIARAALDSGPKGRERVFEVQSPVAGVVLRVLKESEGAVMAGTPLLELGDPQQLEVVVDVLTRDAPRMTPMMRAEVSGWGDAPVKGRVRKVEPAAFSKISPLGVEEQRVNVLVDFDDAPPRVLGDGYSVDVRFVLQQLEKVLIVPSSALFKTDGAWATFVVEEGRAVRRSVEVGATDALAMEVKSGLKEGDRVIVHVGEAVRDGLRVAHR